MQLVVSRVGSSSRVRSAILRFSCDAPLGGRLADLVADRVHDHRRVVDVLGDHRREIVLPPLLELGREVVGDLGPPPEVGELVHHQHAVPVAGPEQGARDAGLCALRIAL